MTDHAIGVYKSWDLSTRLFHWINFACVLILSFLGLIMLNKDAIGISGTDASIGLKTLHVLVGYVFAINLLTRIAMGFFRKHVRQPGGCRGFFAICDQALR